MVKPKSKRSKKNKRVQQHDFDEPTDLAEAPHSFVVHRGLACPYILDLTMDFRKIMEPYTALNLKEKKSNKIKDFVSLSGHFHVSHMCIFNKASTQLSFKIIRLPRGPTLTFKIHQFTLARDVIASTRKQFVDDDIFKTAPLVIMNNFTGDGKHLKLMASTFQNMFPSINLATINLAALRRCVLFSYNPETKLVEMRHYSIVVVPVGLSRGVKKVVLGKIPNLARCDDIADYFAGNALSDSEYEDEEEGQVICPQNLKRKGNLENNKSSVRLHEIGPRCTFELIKIEEGVLTGEVLYHETIIKSEEEIENIRKLRKKKEKLKQQRQKLQNENKMKNEEFKNSKTDKKGLGKKPSKQLIPREPEVEPDNDAEYYKEAVGEDPDEELFKQSNNNTRKRVRIPKHMAFAKKRKIEKEDKNDNGKFNRKEKKKFNEKSDKDQNHKKFKTKGFSKKAISVKTTMGKPKFRFQNKSKTGFQSKSKSGFKSKSKRH